LLVFGFDIVDKKEVKSGEVEMQARERSGEKVGQGLDDAS
jgi:hypothetical protein